MPIAVPGRCLGSIEAVGVSCRGTPWGALGGASPAPTPPEPNGGSTGNDFAKSLPFQQFHGNEGLTLVFSNFTRRGVREMKVRRAEGK